MLEPNVCVKRGRSAAMQTLPEVVGRGGGEGRERRGGELLSLVTLAAFHGHIDFSPTLQIIAGCCESYPPQLAGRSRWSVLTRHRLSDFRGK